MAQFFHMAASSGYVVSLAMLSTRAWKLCRTISASAALSASTMDTSQDVAVGEMKNTPCFSLAFSRPG